MTVILTNIVTIQEERGDVLSPTDYASLVSSIKSIMRDRGYNTLHETYRELLAHLTDLTNPHHDHPDGFREEIIDALYPVYRLMTPSPLSREGFVTQITSGTEYLEFMLRVQENNWLYRALATPLGRIRRSEIIQYDPVAQVNRETTVKFPDIFLNKSDFISSGWSAPVVGEPIQTATDLTPRQTTLPLICAPGEVRSYSLPALSHNLTLSLRWGTLPDVPTVLFSLGTQPDISVTLHPDGSLVVTNKQSELIHTEQIPYACAQIVLTADKLVIVTQKEESHLNIPYPDTLPFSKLTLRVPVRPNPYSNIWGLRELLVYQGIQDFALQLPELDSGYVYVVDRDGRFVIDKTGRFVTTFVYPTLPDGYGFVIDDSGEFLLDEDGSFYIDLL